MPQTFSDVACTVCGCVCDDLQLTFSDGRVTQAAGACRLAEPWFASLSEPSGRPAAAIDGRPVSLDDAIDRAAEILRASRAPLIWGLSRSSTAGQRAAVLLAEQIGATIDTTASVCHGPSIMAIQQVGESTCSLGEVRNRADLVVFWGADPVESHPRHFERYSADAVGLFVPRGRADRHLIVIDSEETATSRLADTFVKIQRDSDFEVIWALRQLLRGIELSPSFDVGVPHHVLQTLASQMSNCRYGAVFFGLGLAQRSIGHKNVEALLRLVEDLNDFTRFTARRLRIPGDVTGADAVLCWLTGFPFAVNLSRGFPRYNPGEYSANDLLERGEVDACLFVGSEPFLDLSPRAQRTVAQLPTIALDYPNAQPPFEATVQITTAIYGIHAPGTAYRMDEVPVPLRQLVPSSLPTDDDVLGAISRQLLIDHP
ncbi:MAG: formylmethanofuran dehydrogenase subunit B [Planctomycetes bacterium]|nr:formylmethanofuran dehydrogenase subunit B [Planctomycetota bacterium]